MAATMNHSKQRSFFDDTKSCNELGDNSPSFKLVPKLKCNSKKSDSHFDDIAPIETMEENMESYVDSQELSNMTMNRSVSCGRIRGFCNAKLEARYRTNSTDSAFSEESFADLDGDENTRLESLIDQLIFTDDRLNSDLSTYVKTMKPSPTDTSILDVGDLFNNANTFSVDYEYLAHDTQISSFIEKETWLDSRQTESISSVSSLDSGEESVQKYPTESSAFLECCADKVFSCCNSSSSVFTSTDENKVIDCDVNDINEPTVQTLVDRGSRGDGCAVDDIIHECSFVNLSTILNINPYENVFSNEENLTTDSERHLNKDNENTHAIKSTCRKTNCNDNFVNANATPCPDTLTKIPMSTSHIFTIKSNSSINHNTNRFDSEIPEIDFLPIIEDETGVSLSSLKDSHPKCMDFLEHDSNHHINECDYCTQESLYKCSLENLSGYGDQEISGMNQHNKACNFLSGTYDESRIRFTFEKGTGRIESKDGHKSSEIKFPTNRDNIKDVDDPKDLNEIKLVDNNSYVVRFHDQLDTVKQDSYFLDLYASDGDDDANIGKAQSNSKDVWILPNEDHIIGAVDKEHSYKAQVPAKYKKLKMSVMDTEGKSNIPKPINGTLTKQNPAKRPSFKEFDPVEQGLTISEEDNLKSSSSKSEYPGLKFLLEEESLPVIDSVLQRSTTSNYYTFSQSDDPSGIRKKLSESDQSHVQPTVLCRVLAMERDSSNPISSSPFPVSPNNSDIEDHYDTNIRYADTSKEEMPMRAGNSISEMKELEKYLRGIIPIKSCERKDEFSITDQQRNSALLIRKEKSACSLLEKLLTGEMTTQTYREIDHQFCINEQLVKNKMKTA